MLTMLDREQKTCWLKNLNCSSDVNIVITFTFLFISFLGVFGFFLGFCGTVFFRQSFFSPSVIWSHSDRQLEKESENNRKESPISICWEMVNCGSNMFNSQGSTDFIQHRRLYIKRMLNLFQKLCCIRLKTFFNGSKLSSQLYEESIASRYINSLAWWESFFIAGVFAGYFFLFHSGPPSKGKWRVHKVIKKGFQDFFLVDQN